jgi:hypothetical protein
MTFLLDTRDDGWLSIKKTWLSLWEPIQITNWWNLGIRYTDFVNWFASEAHALRRIGSEVSPLIHPATCWQDVYGTIYRLPHANMSAAPAPDLQETVPIPEPPQRGRKAAAHLEGWRMVEGNGERVEAMRMRKSGPEMGKKGQIDSGVIGYVFLISRAFLGFSACGISVLLPLAEMLTGGFEGR